MRLSDHLADLAAKLVLDGISKESPPSPPAYAPPAYGGAPSAYGGAPSAYGGAPSAYGGAPFVFNQNSSSHSPHLGQSGDNGQAILDRLKYGIESYKQRYLKAKADRDHFRRKKVVLKENESALKGACAVGGAAAGYDFLSRWK